MANEINGIMKLNLVAKKIVIYLIAIIFIGCLYWFLNQKFLAGNLKILFIGIDGADWEMVTSLIEQGKLSYFKKLIKKGTSIKINSEGDEIGGSPIYWTTIATGQYSEKHGIKDFVIANPKTRERIPYTSNMRKSKAFWNIFSEREISVGVVGWYVTYPVEKVKGFMISSYYALKDKQQPTWKGTIYKSIQNMVYPPTLIDKVNTSIQKAENIYRHNIKNIIKPLGLKTKTAIIVDTEWIFKADEIYNQIGIDLYKKIRPQMFAVYFGGIDVVGHRFTSTSSKEQKEITDIFGDVHRNYYLYINKVVGRFIKFTDRNTIIIIAADHGLIKGKHTNNGVFIICGPHIKQNINLKKSINLTDILPTILYLMRLPVARDMDGRVFKEIISDGYLDTNEIVYIDSYGKREITNNTPMRSEFDVKILERLKSLGYLE